MQDLRRRVLEYSLPEAPWRGVFFTGSVGLICREIHRMAGHHLILSYPPYCGASLEDIISTRGALSRIAMASARLVNKIKH